MRSGEANREKEDMQPGEEDASLTFEQDKVAAGPEQHPARCDDTPTSGCDVAPDSDAAAQWRLTIDGSVDEQLKATRKVHFAEAEAVQQNSAGTSSGGAAGHGRASGQVCTLLSLKWDCRSRH